MDGSLQKKGFFKINDSYRGNCASEIFVRQYFIARFQFLLRWIELKGKQQDLRKNPEIVQFMIEEYALLKNNKEKDLSSNLSLKALISAMSYESKKAAYNMMI